jgi:hypothetical protein
MDDVAILAAVDAAIAPLGGTRAAGEDGFCAGKILGPSELASERAFLCDASDPAGVWWLGHLRADGGSHVGASLEIRRFRSAIAASEAKAVAVERYGGPVVGPEGGAFSWCYDDVIWTDDLLVTLSYGCWISLEHVPALGAARAAVLAAAVPFEPSGAIGAVGAHSGWSYLLGPGGRLEVPDAARFTRFLDVTGVAADDVLWLREDWPGSSRLSEADMTRGRHPGDLRAKVGQLAPDATCIAMVYAPSHTDGWAFVRSGGVQGWANTRYLAPSAAGACDGPR